MKKAYILSLLALSFFAVSCTKNMQNALKMPNSQAATKNYNTAIKADEFSNDFYKACAYGKVSEIEKFIKKGQSVNELDSEGYSPLFYAVLGGNPSAYAESLSKFRIALINDNDEELYAALDSVPDVKSNTKAVSYLLKKGANVQLKDRSERPVFVYAALFANDVTVLSELKNAGANINDTITIQYPTSLLSISCMTNPNTSIIDFLCKQGGNIDEQNQFGTPPIMWAAMYNSNPNVIDVLKNNGADINDKRHKDGYSPLIWAVRCNRNADITERLCKLGADVAATDNYTWHALDWALLNTPSFKWNKKAEDFFSDFSNLQQLKQLNPLREEGKNHHLKVLLKYASEDTKTNALWTACFSSDENFEDLITSIKSFDSDYSLGKTILIAFDNVKKLELLNSKTENDFNDQFFNAIRFESKKAAEYLLPHVSEMEITEQTRILTNCKDKDLLRLFLNGKFIDVFQKDKEGRTLLYAACENNNYEAVKILISKNADVNTICSSQKSRTPLLAQCYKSYPSKDIVELLIRNGAKVNAKDEDGVSPLFAACYKNQNDSVIKVLLNNGANKAEKYDGSYPYEYCNSTIKNNYYSTYKILYDAAPHGYYW
ncbi:MAG: ankyrin repeat domain-containing protein [bacterium]|nr:ankyrin repeat domain-containing protein [bacterium]